MQLSSKSNSKTARLPFPPEDRYYCYSHYLKQTFGTRVYKISLDAGFSCPTRDGSISANGCLYCNNASFAPERRGRQPSVRQQMEAGIATARAKKRGQKFLAYFQAYTNTCAPTPKLARLYRAALDFPEVLGICIGTRPDCISQTTLALLQEISQNSYVSLELGLESVYDTTLEWAKRGHTMRDSIRAIQKVKKSGLHVAAHLILGFPTETRREMLDSTTILNKLPLDALKIHHLHVVKNTPLEKLYARRPFHTFSPDEWILLVSDFLERLRPDIVIQRLCGDARPGTLIAPQWQMPKIEIIRRIREELERRGSYQGYHYRS